MPNEAWLYGQDGHIVQGDIIQSDWEVYDTGRCPEAWIKTERPGMRVGMDDIKSTEWYRKPASKDCSCTACSDGERKVSAEVARWIDTCNERLDEFLETQQKLNATQDLLSKAESKVSKLVIERDELRRQYDFWKEYAHAQAEQAEDTILEQDTRIRELEAEVVRLQRSEERAWACYDKLAEVEDWD